MRREISTEIAQAQRTYNRKCAEVWRSDHEVLAHRQVLGRLRRRERRLEVRLTAELAPSLGVEPFAVTRYFPGGRRTGVRVRGSAE